MFRSYRIRVVFEIRPSRSMSCSQYATRSPKGLSGVKWPELDAGWSSERPASFFFSARSAALAVSAVACTIRERPSQSRYRVRASNRPDGRIRVVISPKLPMVSRGRPMSVRHPSEHRCGAYADSRCSATQARTSATANFRCLPKR